MGHNLELLFSQANDTDAILHNASNQQAWEIFDHSVSAQNTWTYL